MRIWTFLIGQRTSGAIGFEEIYWNLLDDAVLAEGLNHHLFLTRVLSGSGKKAVPR